MSINSGLRFVPQLKLCLRRQRYPGEAQPGFIKFTTNPQIHRNITTNRDSSNNTMNSKHLGQGSEFPPLQEGRLRVYNMRFCPYGQRTLLALEAKEIPHDIINVDLNSKPDWFLERNPLGTVPVIETAQGNLWESLIVNEYLDEIYPDKRKLTSSCSFQKALDKIWIERSSKMTRLFFALMTKQDDPADEIENRFKEMAETLAPLEVELKRRGTPYFGGSQPGILDYAIWPWFERIPVLKISYPTYDFEGARAQNPTLDKWRKGMKDDRAVKASYLSPESHYKFISSRVAGSPNYALDYEVLNN